MSWLRLTKDLAVNSYLSLRRSSDTVYRHLFEQTPSAMDVMADRGHATATGAGQSDENQSSPKRQTRGAAVKNEKERFQSMPVDERRKLYKCQRDYMTLDLIPTMPEYFIEHRKRLFKKVTDRQPKFDVDEKLNEKVSLWKGDITTLEIDVIVNAANSSLLGGGGVDGCIHRAAGSQLKAECAWLQGCETGDCKITCGYKLPAKYVLHTVGPIGNRPQMLRSCYKKCLDTMKENNLCSIAFPCISTGIYGYPNDEACRVALKTVRLWLEENDNAKHVDRVIFCLFLPVDISFYEKFMNLYFPIESNKANGDSAMDADAEHDTSDHSPGKHRMSVESSEEDDNTETEKPSEHGGSSAHATPVKRQGSVEPRDVTADGADLGSEECSPEDGATQNETFDKMEGPVDPTPSK